MIATNELLLALPSDVNVIWQAICIPISTETDMYMRSATEEKAANVSSDVNILTKNDGKSITSDQRMNEYMRLTRRRRKKAPWTRSLFPAPKL